MKKINKKYRPKEKPKCVADHDSIIYVDDEKLKKYASIKSISEFTSEVDDEAIYSIAQKENRHVITSNYKHFEKFPKNKKDVAVIGHKQSLTDRTKYHLIDVFKDKCHEDFYGKIIWIDDSGTKIKKQFDA